MGFPITVFKARNRVDNYLKDDITELLILAQHIQVIQHIVVVLLVLKHIHIGSLGVAQALRTATHCRHHCSGDDYKRIASEDFLNSKKWIKIFVAIKTDYDFEVKNN
jgi:hypothetical protein